MKWKSPTDKRRLTDEQLAAAIERLRQRSTPARLAAMQQQLRKLGIDPATLDSLKPDEGKTDEHESR